MDIELLSKMVGELVQDHREVGLPGLGTFVSEFVPASFSDRGYTINPPYKRVTFVPGTVTDDSLIKLHAASNGIDEDKSRAIITHFLEGVKKVLLDRKIVVFPGLGRLRATRQNNIFFITDESLDIYPDGFGLQPVSLKNHEESPAEVHHVVESLADILVVPAEDIIEPAEEHAESTAEEPAEVPGDEPAEVPAEASRQKTPEMSATPASEQGLPTKSAKNDRMVRAEARAAACAARKAARMAAKAARSQARAARKAARMAAKAARTEARAARKSARAEAKAARSSEKAAAKAARAEARAARKSARAQARAARRANRKPVSKWVWLAPLLVIAIAAFAFAAFMILVQVAPDFIDSLLYTPEELRIINY